MDSATKAGTHEDLRRSVGRHENTKARNNLLTRPGTSQGPAPWPPRTRPLDLGQPHRPSFHTTPTRTLVLTGEDEINYWHTRFLTFPRALVKALAPILHRSHIQ